MAETFPAADLSKNGSFLEGIIPAGAEKSPLGPAVASATEQFIGNGELSYALSHIKERGALALTDYWKNQALVGFEYARELTGFNDAVSQAGPRMREHYLGALSLRPGTKANPLNEDPEGRFPGFRPHGFEIKADEQPVMAIVALDPSLLSPNLGSATAGDLIDEVKKLRTHATSADKAVRDGVANAMSPKLRQVLSSTLLTNNAFTEEHSPDGAAKEWNLPFDVIASLKALYTLLSNEASSGAMRQGAVRMGRMGELGKEIVVGCSGLNPAIDEMVARNFAETVLAAN